MMTLEQAIAKATKLLRLSESSNANEAALAASMAQRILARYEIDAATLSLDGGPSAPIEEVSRNHDALEVEKRLAAWKHSLASHIAKANQCRAFASRSHRGLTGLILVGRASDVAKTRYMYSLLVAETDKLAAMQAKGQGRGYANSFRLGVVAAIGDKMREARASVAADMRAEAGQDGHALQKIDQALSRIEQAGHEVDAWIRAHMSVGSAQRNGASDAAARQAGYAAGQSINVGGSARGALGTGQKRLA